MNLLWGIYSTGESQQKIYFNKLISHTTNPNPGGSKKVH